MMELNGKFYRELRCRKCRKLIGYEYIRTGRFAYICPRCEEITEFEFKILRGKNIQDTMDKEFTIMPKAKGGDK